MQPWTVHREKLGPLQCAIVDGGAAPELPVILGHGYGAPGDDLLGLAEAYLSMLGPAAGRFRFVFPAAPLQPDELSAFGGRAWWPLNIAALLAASQSGTFEELHDKVPPGIDQASGQLVECLEAVFRGFPGGHRDRPYVLGGFSQGAMLSLNVALSGPLPPPLLLLVYSGTLVCKPRWQSQLQSGGLAQTDVVQSHGRLDTVLPMSSAEVLGKMIEGHCRSYHFVPFDGPHTIPVEAVSATVTRLSTLAGGS